MNDDKLKNTWNKMSTKFSAYGTADFEQIIKLRPTSIQDKIRKMFQLDLILKSVTAIMFVVDLYVYFGEQDIVFVVIVGMILLAIMTFVQLKILKQFDVASETGRPTKEALSDIMVYIGRKAVLLATVISSTSIVFFVAGLLLYFKVAHGFFKPLTAESFFVFSVFCLIGAVTQYARTSSQLKFHIQHLSAFLSDLNDDALLSVSASIENRRKQDLLIKGLVAVVLGFGFIIMIAVLKSIAVL